MPSSVISYMTYDREAQRLRVHFLSGAIYDYIDVPEEVYLQMKSAKSKGIFLNKRIKGKYSFDKIN
ncbi:KTSC domain-containing protein [Chitinophaga sp.]|uniref:KTSC domain-containing protein n=1 Tax=Chitinophaga sp. TaxID=1869181 RepID=UPI0031DA7F15